MLMATILILPRSRTIASDFGLVRIETPVFYRPIQRNLRRSPQKNERSFLQKKAHNNKTAGKGYPLIQPFCLYTNK